MHKAGRYAPEPDAYLQQFPWQRRATDRMPAGRRTLHSVARDAPAECVPAQNSAPSRERGFALEIAVVALIFAVVLALGSSQSFGGVHQASSWAQQISKVGARR